MNIKILYEDEDLLAIDKPTGLLVHPDLRNAGETLVDWILEKYPTLSLVGEEQIVQGKIIRRPGIVHRLDRETSGGLIIAKSQNSFEYLKNKFKNREVEKVYRAFVYGSFADGIMRGVIDKPIGRSASDFRKWSAEYGAKGELRPATTHYSVLKQNKNFAYLELEPKTGRTHQIRVHLKSISHPVICDSLYTSNKEPALGFTRLALHAFAISLVLPNGEELKISSPLPPDFLEAEKLLF